MGNYQTLSYEVRDRVGLLTLNRPDRVNAINDRMTAELAAFWSDRRQDGAVRVIIFSGAGDRGFCSGLDLKDTFPVAQSGNLDAMYKIQSSVSRLILAMRQAPQPIIGAIHGAAVGGGLSFALGCCARIVSPEVRFAAAYVDNGLTGTDCGSSYFLPRMIGAGRAYEFLLTGDVIDAETALQLGLISRIVPREALMETALELGSKMCRKNPLGLRLTKEAVNCNLDAAGLEQALNLEDRNQTVCMATIRYEGQSSDTV